MNKFMKLGIISYGYQDEDFDYIRNRGLDFVEFCINTNEQDFLKEIDAIKSRLEQRDLQVASIGRWGTDRIGKDGINQEELEVSYQLIDASSKLGCPVFVAGCNYIEELSFARNVELATDYFRQLIAYGKTKDVRIAVYNCRWNNFIVSEETWKLVHGSLEDLYIKYDPSHCIYDGSGEYLKEISDWGERILHFHLKGSLKIDGRRIDDPPAGLDQTNWPAVIALLVAKGYQGVFSVEPHSGVWTGDLGERGIDYTIDYFRKFNF